jgi:hypothetical protein
VDGILGANREFNGSIFCVVKFVDNVIKSALLAPVLGFGKFVLMLDRYVGVNFLPDTMICGLLGSTATRSI